MLRELRHDFRHYYGCRYDDVPTDEAIDLIRSLPDGSRWVARTDPLRAWSAERHREADLLDAVSVLVWRFALDKETVPEPPKVVRPRDMAARMREAANNRRVRQELESGGWEEM